MGNNKFYRAITTLKYAYTTKMFSYTTFVGIILYNIKYLRY